MEQLTVRQMRVLEGIRGYMRAAHRVPTVREIGAALGLRSSCTVQRHLEALERKGAITRRKGARGIALVNGPCPLCGSTQHEEE